MKKYRITTLLVAVLSLVATGLFAQYDDIYYNPDENRTSDFQRTERQQYSYDNEATANNNNGSYNQFDDETYDYYYTSRIRRFHRPTYGFGYFDPIYTDMYYYDPFLMPGRTMLIYDTPFSYASWARWNRWNRMRLNPFAWGGFGPGFFGPSLAFRSGFGVGFGAGFGAPVGFGAPWGGFWPGSAFYGPGLYTGGFYNGFNTGFAAGFGSALYCPPTYGAGYSYNTVNNIAANNTTYGPRSRTSSTAAPRTNIPRTDRPNTNTVTSRSGRSGDVRGNDRRATPTRVTPNSDRLRPTTIDRSRITRDRSRSTRSIDRSRSVDRSVRQSPRSRTYTTPRTTTPRSRSTIRRQAPSRRNYTPSRTRTMSPRSSGSSIRRATPSRSSTPRSSGSRTSSRRGGGK